jgi:TRAP-type mannitol/chloroaromatic compound transport system substrate-binding protein
LEVRPGTRFNDAEESVGRVGNIVILLSLLFAPAVAAQQRDIAVEPSRITFKGRPLYERSWAVLIGIDRYQHPRVPSLQFAVNDVRSMKATLLRLGFQQDRIFELTDRQATKRGIENLLGDRLRKLVGRQDRVLIFFAGHGRDEEVREGKDEGYLVPYDGDPDQLYSTAISMSALTQIAERLPAKHVLFAVDACYSGFAAFKGRAIVNPELVEDLTKRPAVQVLTAGRKGELAQEKEGQGLFTGILIKGLEGQADRRGWGWVSLDMLGEYVRDRVYAESGRRQYPQFGNLSGEGQFVFVLPGGQVAKAAPPPEPPKPIITEEVRQELGSLAVSSKIAGVEVWLGDQKIGETRAGRALIASNLPVGSYRVRGTKPGLPTWEQEVRVAANQRTEVVIDIEPLRPEPPVTDTTVRRWKAQSAFPSGMIFYEGAERFARTLEDLSNGRLKVIVLPAGAVVPAFEIHEAVSRKVLDAGFASPEFLFGKASWTALFSGQPFGLGAEEMAGWLQRGGGLALQQELYRNVLGLDLVVFQAGTTGERMAGWFRTPISSPSDLRGVKIRAVGLSAQILRNVGATVVLLPGGEIIPALERGVLDAAVWIGPHEDLRLGLQNHRKVYHRPAAWREPAGSLELIVNRQIYEALPNDLQQKVAEAARQAHDWMLSEIRARNARALDELMRVHGVRVYNLPTSVLEAVRQAAQRTLEEHAAKDPTFQRVWDAIRRVRR